VIAIAALQIGVHPDMTPPLQLLAILAIAAGWLAAGSSNELIHCAWLMAALLAPAVLRIAVGREGPVLDVFWMAGLSASLLRTVSWSRWSLGEGSRVLAAGWALILALSWPVLVAREAAFDWHLLFDGGAINSWGMRSAPQVTSWTMFVVWGHLLGLLWLDWLSGRFAGEPERPPRVLHALWIGSTLASLVALYQGVADMAFLSTPQWTGLARATGTLLDANAYGFCAALAGPSAVLSLHGSRSKQAATVIALVYAINLAGVWMSGSRTAAVCAIVGVAAVGAMMWRSPGRMRRLVPLAAGGVAVLVAGLVLTAGAVGPARRLFDKPAESSGMISTVLIRGGYGSTAHAIIRDYPITGVGMGGYHEIAPDYWRHMADESLPFDNAQNWWRHQAAELGLLGGLPLFAWSGLIAWRVLFSRSRRDRLAQAMIVRGLLLAIGVCSLIQVPTQSPTVLLWFFLLLAWLPAVINEPHATISAAPRAIITVLAIAYAGAHLVLARGPLAVAERAKTFQREYVAGAHGPEQFEGSGQFRWTDDQARFLWPARTRWFVIQIWAQHPDVEQNPVHVTVTTPCGTLFDQALDGRARRSVGVMLPEGQRSLDATIRVSRTWQPSAYGIPDTRRLGVGIAGDSVANREQAMAADVPVELQACPAGV
jgi:hypothetical protein